MTLALLAIDDGRDRYAAEALRSALEHLPKFDQYIFIDDRQHKLGFAGAIAAGWSAVNTDYVFHFEQDFTFPSAPPVQAMLGILERHPHIAQVSLKRQAWNTAERRAGGIVELHPDWFETRQDAHATWTEHRAYFTTNPSVYRRNLCSLGWPQVPQSEGVFTHRLLADPSLRFAILGAKFDAPRTTHIGDKREGTGY